MHYRLRTLATAALLAPGIALGTLTDHLSWGGGEPTPPPEQIRAALADDSRAADLERRLVAPPEQALAWARVLNAAPRTIDTASERERLAGWFHLALEQAGFAHEARFEAVRIIPGERRVRLDHDLIDPQRIAVGALSHHQKITEGGARLGGEPVIAESPRTGRSSLDLMRAGLAPVGPESAPIALCRLHRSDEAPYLELPAGEVAHLDRLLAETFEPAEHCLDAEAAAPFWRARAGDFFTDRGHPRTPEAGEPWPQHPEVPAAD